MFAVIRILIVQFVMQFNGTQINVLYGAEALGKAAEVWSENQEIRSKSYFEIMDMH